MCEDMPARFGEGVCRISRGDKLGIFNICSVSVSFAAGEAQSVFCHVFDIVICGKCTAVVRRVGVVNGSFAVYEHCAQLFKRNVCAVFVCIVKPLRRVEHDTLTGRKQAVDHDMAVVERLFKGKAGDVPRFYSVFAKQ